MNKQEQQYYDYFVKLGYKPKFYPEKHSFKIDDIYLKVCDYPVSEFIRQQAIDASYKMQVVLLSGNLSFKDYEVFNEGVENVAFMVHSESKYHRTFYGEFDVEYFPVEAKAIADVILGGKELVCRRCGSINDFIVEKNLHYKATCKCGSFITNLPTNRPVKLHFGKYAGRDISSMVQKEEVEYLKWILSNMSLKQNIVDAINSHLGI